VTEKDAVELLKLLLQVRACLEDTGSPAEASLDLASHIQRVESRDFTRMFDLKLLFAPTGSLQDISIDHGWGEEFLELAKRFDELTQAVPPPSP
jgi:hypothetical protein